MSLEATARRLRRTGHLVLALCVGLLGCAAPGPRDAAPTVTHALGGGDETDGGLGGTGILGTITGFGSIHVNELRLRHPENAEVASAIGPADVGDLKVGEVVLARARETTDGLVVTRLARYLPLVGPVTAIDLDARELRVLGATVAVPEDAVILGPSGRRIAFAGLLLRSRVAVSGFWDGDRVVARHMRTVRPGSPDSVSGPVALEANGSLSIGGVPVAEDGGALPGSHAALTAIGRFEDGRLFARRFETGLATPLVPGVTALSVQGYPRGDGARAWLSGQPGIAVSPEEIGRFGLFEGRVGALGERAARRGITNVARRGLISALGERELATLARDALRDRVGLPPAEQTRAPSSAPPPGGRRAGAIGVGSRAAEAVSRLEPGSRLGERRDAVRTDATSRSTAQGSVGPAAAGTGDRSRGERSTGGPPGRSDDTAGRGRGSGDTSAGGGRGGVGPGGDRGAGPGSAGPGGGDRGAGPGSAGPGGGGRGAGPGSAGPGGGRGGPGPGGGGRGGGPSGGEGPGGRS